MERKELKKEVLRFSQFWSKSEWGLMKMKKILNGETNFCSVSASSEISVANIDLNCLFRFVGHDFTFQDKTNIGTCVKYNKNQSCLLVITYSLHLDFMARLPSG